MQMKSFIFIFCFSITSILYSQQSISFYYDDLHRLIKADYGGGVVINYTYDANGNRLTEIVNSNSFVNVKMVLSGFYNEPDNVLRKKDTVRAYLMNINSPFGTVDSSVSTLDSASFLALFEFRNAPTGTYYLKIKHRNSIETWSKNGGFNFIRYSFMNYDFTSAQSQAFGNNMILKDSLWSIYSGDVDQNGFVDGTDQSLIDNDAYNFVSGYVNSDLTGDNFVDASDAAIAENNAANFVGKIIP